MSERYQGETLYLASGSPRRHELMRQLGWKTVMIPSDINELPLPNESVNQYVMRMAIEKNGAAREYWQQQYPKEPDLPLLTADTTVALDNMILSKPHDAEDARRMLLQLSGRTHQVLTAVCLYWKQCQTTTLSVSHVTLKILTPEEIDAYIISGEPMDKAGSYGIQGLGGVLISHLEGSFTGVMGLPVYETTQLLKQAGIDLPAFQVTDSVGRV